MRLVRIVHGCWMRCVRTYRTVPSTAGSEHTTIFTLSLRRAVRRILHLIVCWNSYAHNRGWSEAWGSPGLSSVLSILLDQSTRGIQTHRHRDPDPGEVPRMENRGLCRTVQLRWTTERGRKRQRAFCCPSQIHRRNHFNLWYGTGLYRNSSIMHSVHEPLWVFLLLPRSAPFCDCC
eukprot:COSAG02_NODE_12269_length_1571_cov_1.760870_2_plen_176_part_00